jgi:hypothetical protein
MNDETFYQVLEKGYKNVPNESNCVRIFLSSTFSDTKEERNYLVEKIYPQLRKYCEDKKLEFQVLDMRWGISSELAENHKSNEICLNEIKRCQEHSIGPNFIAFLSHRYGSRSVPACIEQVEFEELRNEIKDEADLKFLNHCFEFDSNSKNFLLKKPKVMFPENTRNNWNAAELKLIKLFRQSIESLNKKVNTTELSPKHFKYVHSSKQKYILIYINKF